MPPPLPYFKVNICPFPLPHFASIYFFFFVILSLTQLYRYTPELFLFSTAIFKYTYRAPLSRIGQEYSANVAFATFKLLKQIQPLPGRLNWFRKFKKRCFKNQMSVIWGWTYFYNLHWNNYLYFKGLLYIWEEMIIMALLHMAGLENSECIWKIQRKSQVGVSVSIT
jgi:hypothetical protein